jgi:hypothetical protein
MNYKKIFLISFLITLGFCLLSWACTKLDIEGFEFPFILFYGIRFLCAGLEAFFLSILLFAILWSISFVFTFGTFFITQEEKK